MEDSVVVLDFSGNEDVAVGALEDMLDCLALVADDCVGVLVGQRQLVVWAREWVVVADAERDETFLDFSVFRDYLLNQEPSSFKLVWCSFHKHISQVSVWNLFLCNLDLAAAFLLQLSDRIAALADD